MLYLNYAKQMENGFILNFFADSDEDLKEVSDGREFVTKNGTNYGVPLASSTIIVTYPDKTKKTFVLMENGQWREGLTAQSSLLENFYGIPCQLTNLFAENEEDGYYHLNPYGRFLEDPSWGNWFLSSYPAEKRKLLKELGFRVAEILVTPELFEDTCRYRALKEDKMYIHTFYDLAETPIWEEKGISAATLKELASRRQEEGTLIKWDTISYVCKVVKGVTTRGVPVACVVNADCTNTFEELAYLTFMGNYVDSVLAENYDSLKFLYSYWIEGDSVAAPILSLSPIIRDDRVNSIIHQVTEI